MTPVYQTRTGAQGNCFAACIASILDIPLSTVPDFTDDGFVEEVAEFLQPRNLLYMRVSKNDPLLKQMFGYGKCYHTIEGTSTRGGPHACVGMNGKIVFDPHPGARPPNLVQVEYFGVFLSRFSHARKGGDSFNRERLHQALDRVLAYRKR